MKTILHIISSARGDQSYSLGLSSALLYKLQERENIQSIVERDLTKEFPSFLDSRLIFEFYKYPGTTDEEGEKLLEYSNTIYNEIAAADIIIIGTPMHNFGISAPLKAWIDQLVRFGKTYTYNNDGSRSGIFKNKKIYLAIASGGISSGLADENEYIETYLKAVFKEYTGITNIDTYRVENTAQPQFVPNYEEILENL